MLRFGLTLCSLFLIAFCGYAQDTVEVRVRPESTLEIHGETNINSFTCAQVYRMPDFTRIELVQDGQQIIFDNPRMSIPVKAFDCGHKIMTRDFQEILEADKIPYLVITLHAVTSRQDIHVADVTIQIAGRAQKYSIPLRVIRNREGVTGIGERQVRFADFGLEPPVKFMGMVKVKEALNISFTVQISQIR